MNSKNRINELFQNADIKIVPERSGLSIRPSDIRLFNDNFYNRVMAYGSLGLGEAYLENWWDCQELDVLFYKLLKSELNKQLNLFDLLFALKARLFNLQSMSKAFEVGECHYDLGNDLYQCMLDKRMVYTCGYWGNASNLDEAQEAKLELICQKLDLKPGMRVLDIGCGWGSFAKYAAEKYNVKVTGITISKEQQKLAQELCKGLDVEFKLIDYRQLQKSNEFFDRVVSIGMLEHVGVKNYKEFMKAVSLNLAPDGIFLLHTIGNNLSVKEGEPFINKYIFPNGMIPSIQQIGKSSEGLFIIENLQNIGLHYDKTLMSWYENFNNNYSYLKSKNPQYNSRFYRLWKYYLLSCAGAFRARHVQVWQIVFTKNQRVAKLNINNQQLKEF